MPLPTRRLVVVLGVAALAVPNAALASSDKSGARAHGQDKTVSEDHGKSKGAARAKRVKLANYVLRGTYAADGTVGVTSGNSHARRGGLVGEDVDFDFSKARVVVADTDGNGEATAADLAAGDRVVVQVRLPRRTPGTGPYVARKVVDQTNPPATEDDVENETEASS